MANLLPQEYLNIVKKERHIRAAAAFCVAIIFAATLGSIFLLPSLFLLGTQVRDRERATAIVQGLIQSQDGDTVLSEVSRAKSQIERLVGELDTVAVFKVLTALQDTIPPGILVESINYSKDKGKAKILRVSGTSDTRDALLSFRRLLEREPLFGNVTLPVSSLANDADISFSVTFDILDSDVVETSTNSSS